MFTKSKFWVCMRGRKPSPQLGAQGFMFIAFVNFMLSVKGIKMRSLKPEFSFPITTWFRFMLYHTPLLGFHPFIIDIGHLKHLGKTSRGSSTVPQSIILASCMFRSIFIQCFQLLSVAFLVQWDECNDSCINYNCVLNNPHSKNDGAHHFKYFIKITQCKIDKVDLLDNEKFINFTRILESLERSWKWSLTYLFFEEGHCFREQGHWKIA